MPEEQKLNPPAFIATGVCFMGAGVALSAALRESGAGGVGVGLVGLGVMFLILGLAQRKKLGARRSGDDDDGPSA